MPADPFVLQGRLQKSHCFATPISLCLSWAVVASVSARPQPWQVSGRHCTWREAAHVIGVGREGIWLGSLDVHRGWTSPLMVCPWGIPHTGETKDGPGPLQGLESAGMLPSPTSAEGPYCFMVFPIDPSRWWTWAPLTTGGCPPKPLAFAEAWHLARCPGQNSPQFLLHAPDSQGAWVPSGQLGAPLPDPLGC